MRSYYLRLAASALIIIACMQAKVLGQDAIPAKETKKEAGQSAEKKGGSAPFANVIAGLKATPGCLGVETARISGKNVVFAWFENKQAVMKWYYSDTHQDLMHRGFPDAEYKKPLKDVPKDSGPIMVIASLTLAKEPHFKSSPMPISQIAIELYQPLPGGTFVGGRFAPASFKVPHMRDYTSADKQP
jgi:hypothetical protein